MQLMDAADRGRYRDCLDIATQMKAEGFQPDLATYTALMTAASAEGHWLDAWAILDDMTAVGVKPDVAVFNALLKAQFRCSSQNVWQVIKKMDELGVAPNAATYTFIIRRFVDSGNLELAVQYFHDMKGRQIVPQVNAAQSLIAFAAQSGYPRLAIDLATWFEGASIRRLDHTVWVKCLVSSAEGLYMDGVLSCWKKVVHELKMKPGEGVCLSVLDTAARNGYADLATDVLRVMKLTGIEWQEYHFAPLIEAFCRGKQFKEAIQALEIMRTEGIEPQPETAYPISEAMTDTEAVDSTWAIIDELQKDGKSVDITVLQALIKASVKLGDLQRAIGAYKSLPEYGAAADLTIFNLLLQGCRRAAHRELGDLLLTDLKAAKVKPNQETYETFISLCLTQDDYEGAFFYLEEMKAAGFHPSRAVYDALVRKCIASSDPRFKIALEEMEDQGHQPSSQLRRLVRGAYDAERNALSPIPDLDVAAAEPLSIDGAARRFIETGGVEGAVELPKEHVG
ncbi:putative pentatricopeptide repeat domain containing protein [Lyophyllum shimeji]|uniref:Pentatricopeptide repeat domain containing protein n=1 Tax=Lyophyllum shimeji TaxID=47721 RepID=A0A9P3PKN2_LYOSH|nr:putative pentatricopeptide repeat domain containing protein [Lyophyllum shimeji]